MVQMTECDYDKSPSPLYKAIEAKNWDVIEEMDNLEQQCATWVVRKEPTGRLRWRLLPLHAAIIFQAPTSILEILIGIYPDAAAAKDDQGMLPLHLVLRNAPTDLGALEELLTAHPAGVLVHDRKGRTPLQSGLAAQGDTPTEASVLTILDMYTSIVTAASAAQQQQQQHLQPTGPAMAALVNQHAQRLTELRDAFEEEQKRRQRGLQETIQKQNAMMARMQAEFEKERQALIRQQALVLADKQGVQAKLDEAMSDLAKAQTKVTALNAAVTHLQVDTSHWASQCLAEKQALQEWEERCTQMWQDYRTSQAARTRRQQEFWTQAQEEILETERKANQALEGVNFADVQDGSTQTSMNVLEQLNLNEEKKEIDPIDLKVQPRIRYDPVVPTPEAHGENRASDKDADLADPTEEEEIVAENDTDDLEETDEQQDEEAADPDEGESHGDDEEVEKPELEDEVDEEEANDDISPQESIEVVEDKQGPVALLSGGGSPVVVSSPFKLTPEEVAERIQQQKSMLHHAQMTPSIAAPSV